jgi:hypothetical protein
VTGGQLARVHTLAQVDRDLRPDMLNPRSVDSVAAIAW